MNWPEQPTNERTMPISAPPETGIAQKKVNEYDKVYYNIIIPQTKRNSSMNCKFYETDIFNQVKNMIDITDILKYYGVSINNKGFATCPFHNENTPSFKVYDGSYHCFGCGESGTVIDFVMKYFGLTNIDAVKKLNADFKLNLPLRKSEGIVNCDTPHKNRKLVGNFIAWEKKAFITVSSYFRALKFWGKQIFINESKYFEQYLSDVQSISFVENMLDQMIGNMHDFPAQVEFYKDYGRAVAYIEQKFNH